MKIGYVCTNYNNSAFTSDAVESLLRNTNHDIKIVIVDNASSEIERSKLRPLADRHASVQVIENEENVGYFSGLNVGISALREAYPDFDWIVAGNNDIEFPPDFCDSIQRNADKFRMHSVISPDVVTLDGMHQNPHVIEKISPFRELVYDIYYSSYYLGLAIHKIAKMFPSISERTDELQWQIARPIYQGHGSCYLLTPKFFRQFNELWSPTFLMAEELFLSKQLSDVGEKVFYDPCIKIIHHWHGALENIPSRQRWEMSRSAHREYRRYVGIFGGLRDRIVAGKKPSSGSEK